MFIRINGQTNRLTGINHTYANGNTQFNYLVTMKEDGTAFIRMGKGHYILKNFETWTGMAQPLEKTEQLYSQAVTLIGGTTATYGGDGITGVVSAERDGYLITSIPYDENFVLKVDGKETLLFRANTAFLGAKISTSERRPDSEKRNSKTAANGQERAKCCKNSGNIISSECKNSCSDAWWNGAYLYSRRKNWQRLPVLETPLQAFVWRKKVLERV